ncbi:ABC transporter permease subunit [Pusillimonas sp. MFBS29]|uniref:ABC transporter permease n=1 Tax=Pusillimonas sp. MFBS29 TaxID=2886690 RepID=UPI001D12E7C7|nr:ABC transporter permease subunit [Pusillimonas sp. MFBS29]MCC2595862.1 ABC transporter permease subunit [Pusillimonas sp. MFBS29]
MSDDVLRDSARPNVYKEPKASESLGIVENSLPLMARLWDQGWLRKLLVLAVLACLWEVYARYLDNELLLPTFTQTCLALFDATFAGQLPERIGVSLDVLMTGYVAGIALAALLTLLAITTRLGTDFLEVMTAMFNPLPAIALLPLALIWFGLGKMTMVFVLVHSVLWAVTLNTYSGFQAVSPTLKMVGRNYGLSHLSFIMKILIPAAFPSILSGLKIGWAFAWRTLIAAELVFGVSSSSGGLGWFIYESKNQLDIAAVFAGLLTIIIIGLVVENLIFRTIEQRTIQRWGMQT